MSGTTVTADDVVKIIKACKQSGVGYLKYETLEMRFDTEIHLNKTKDSTNHMDVVSASVEGQPPGPEAPSLDERMNDYGISVEEQVDQLAIEDPAAFEELQMRIFNKGDAN